MAYITLFYTVNPFGNTRPSCILVKVRKGAKIRSRYNQVPAILDYLFFDAVRNSASKSHHMLLHS